MDLLRWILLGLGLLLIGGIWFQGRRNRPAHQESLLDTARRRWTREARSGGGDDASRETAGEALGDEVDLPDRTEPDLGFDPAEFDELFGRRREPAEPDVTAGTDPARQVHDGRGSRREGPPARAQEGVAGATTRMPDDSGGETSASDRAARDAARRDGGESRAARDSGNGGGTSGSDEHIVVLYVVAGKGERLSGNDLRQAFAGLGLEHGELDIFHRFDESGRTVFSVANAAEPGTFDPPNMADMETPGVALFARLPAPFPATEVFDEMVEAAHTLAATLGARPLDERQSTLTRQTEQAMRDELLEYEHRVARNRT